MDNSARTAESGLGRPDISFRHVHSVAGSNLTRSGMWPHDVRAIVSENVTEINPFKKMLFLVGSIWLKA